MTLRSTLFAALAALPAAAQEAPEAAREAPRFEERDGLQALVWDGHVLMQLPGLERDGQRVDFDPARVRFEADGDGYRVVPATAEDAGT